MIFWNPGISTPDGADDITVITDIADIEIPSLLVIMILILVEILKSNARMMFAKFKV